MLKNLAGRGAANNSQKIKEVKHWVQESLALPPETTILITELTCTEPGCPPLETVIALLRGPGDNVQEKIHRSIAEVTKEEIETLCTRFPLVTNATRNA
ncbi:MAG: hypothetical protein FJ147_14995 [Deltaproteobacteria bacterium]|nr:hypothetical protein [Deltaproteobacteria bacterium]